MDKIIIEHLSVQYEDGTESLKDISLNIREKSIMVLFGPAGGGKSTLLRTLNRLNDLAEGTKMDGKILMNGENLLDPNINVVELRRRVGMVFSRPVPLPLTVYENITYGLKLAGEKNKSHLDEVVEQSLRQVVMWDEIYDRLHDPAHRLSGGQQQRLCLARVLALKPEVIMLDEPTSALDPISTLKIEGLLHDLSENFTIILAPHNTQQAARMADDAAFFLQGELVEIGAGKEMFVRPKDKRTQDYVAGRFG